MHLFASLIFSITAALLGASTEKDFLVIGNPAAAQLYDQYEQLLSPSQKKSLPRNMPLEVTTKRQLMGDQITPGMHLTFSNNDYYLMLDESGKPSGLPIAANATFHKNCIPWYDTLSIAATLTLSSADAGQPRLTLKKGEAVIRIFTRSGKTYLYHVATRRFGWVDASPSSFTKQPVKIKPAAVSFDDLHLRIMKRLAHANDQYDSVFSFFNTLTHQDRAVPQWKHLLRNGVYSYTLVGSAESVTQLETSTGYIVNDVERLLLGKPFAVNYQSGTITITSR